LSVEETDCEDGKEKPVKGVLKTRLDVKYKFVPSFIEEVVVAPDNLLLNCDQSAEDR
jgi:hypothetical protein